MSDADSDTTVEAIAFRDVYNACRRELLRAHTWNFAIDRASLSALGSTPAFGWDYAYGLPSDFLRVISVHPDDNDAAYVEYRIESIDVSGTQTLCLMCDATTVYLKYVRDVTETTLMTETFRDVLAMRIAAELARALPASNTDYELLIRDYRRAMMAAKSIDGIEDYPPKWPDGTWLSERWG